jgi:hypothetical protein
MHVQAESAGVICVPHSVSQSGCVLILIYFVQESYSRLMLKCAIKQLQEEIYKKIATILVKKLKFKISEFS